MADWTTELPGAVSEGDATHVADHNAIVSAIAEARNAVDAAEGLISSLEAALDGKAESSHQHAVSQVDGLQAALDGKQDSGSYATTDQVDGRQAALDATHVAATYATTDQLTAQADGSAVAGLESGVAALETPEA